MTLPPEHEAKVRDLLAEPNPQGDAVRFRPDPGGRTPDERAENEARQFLIVCRGGSRDDRAICRMNQREFVWNYVSAKSGDYEDQKNVAFMLYHGTGGGIMRDLVQACAWAAVVSGSGDVRMNGLQQRTYDEWCAPLTPAQRQIVRTRTSRLRQELRTAPTHPPSDGDRSPPILPLRDR